MLAARVCEIVMGEMHIHTMYIPYKVCQVRYKTRRNARVVWDDDESRGGYLLPAVSAVQKLRVFAP